MPYVYRHIRLDKNQPFYIGIGLTEDNYKRAYSILNRNKYWRNIVNKTDYEIEIIYDDISIKDAYKKEKEFIKLYGRKDNKTGILVNMTDGGDGVVGKIYTDEYRKKLSIAGSGNKNPNYGKTHTKEARKKISIANIGRKATDETRKKMSLSQIGRKHSDETKNKISLSKMGKPGPFKGKKFTEEHKMRIAKALTGKKRPIEVRRKISETRLLKSKLKKNN